MINRSVVRSLIAALMLIVCAEVLAATYTWVGPLSGGMWSVPANWSPSAVPGAGDTLFFTQSNGSSTNDLPSGAVFGRILFDGSLGYAISGNSIALTDGITNNRTVSVPPYNVVNMPVDLLASQPITGGVRLNGLVNIHAFTVATSQTDFEGGITGSGTLTGSATPESLIIGGGNASLNFTGAIQAGVTLNNAATVATQSSADGGIVAMGVSGLHSISTGGPIYLGSNAAAAQLRTGSVTVTPNTSVIAYLNGPNEGEYSQLQFFSPSAVAGPGPCTLRCHPEFIAYLNFGPIVVGEGFIVIKSSTSFPEFENLPEGSTLTLNGVQFRVSYKGGGGNSFTLSAITGVAPATTTTLTSAMNPSRVGQPVMFIAVANGNNPQRPPIGNIVFYDNGQQIGSGVTHQRTVFFSTSSLSPGSHSITAGFGGDLYYPGSISEPLIQVVSDASSTTLQTTPNPSANGQLVMMTSTVTTAGGPPSGNVAFLDSNVTIGSAPLVNGTATFSTPALTPGSHNLSAFFEPTTNVQSSTSNVVVQQVDSCPMVAPPSHLNVAFFGSSSGCTAMNGVPCNRGEQIGFSIPGYAVQSCDQATWTFGDASNATGGIVTHAYNGSGSFSVAVTVTNVRGTGSGSATVNVADDAQCVAPAIVGQPAGAVIGPGEQVTLNVTATGTATLAYEWYEGVAGDVSNPLAGTMSVMTTPHLASSRRYWVRVRNGCGKADSLAALLTVTTRRRGAGH